MFPSFDEVRFRSRYWLYHNIGTLNEISSKYRANILLISAIIIFTSPNASLTFGSASLSGLGISVDPPQTIPIGPFLFALLIYKFIALWAEIIIANGTNEEKTSKKLLDRYNPHLEEYDPQTPQEQIQYQAESDVYDWQIRKIIWDIAPPNILTLICAIKFAHYYITQ